LLQLSDHNITQDNAAELANDLQTHIDSFPEHNRLSIALIIARLRQIAVEQ